MVPTPITVLLQPIEKRVALWVGKARNLASIDSPDAHGLEATPEERLQIHLQGAQGESVLAKHLNIYWCGSLNTFQTEKDVGKVFEVRSVDTMRKRLIIRPNDSDDTYFVCVAVLDDGTYAIKGYYLAKDAKRDEWKYDGNGRKKCWMVPNDELRDPQELKDLYTKLTK